MSRGPRARRRPRVAEVAARAAVLRRLELEVAAPARRQRVSGDHLHRRDRPGQRARRRPRVRARRRRAARSTGTSRPARSTTHVRTTEADRELETWVVVDRSASLDFGTARAEKRDVVLGATAAFGMLTVRGHNRFGVLVAGAPAPAARSPARPGRTLADGGARARCTTPRGRPCPAARRPTSPAALRRLLRRPRRGAARSSSSPTSSAPPTGGTRCGRWRCATRSSPCTSPTRASCELPAVGMLAVVDPETGRQLHVQTARRRLRDRYAAAAAAAARRRSPRSCAATGAEYLHLSTDRDWLIDTLRFVTGRAARLSVGGASTSRPRAAPQPRLPGGTS